MSLYRSARATSSPPVASRFVNADRLGRRARGVPLGELSLAARATARSVASAAACSAMRRSRVLRPRIRTPAVSATVQQLSPPGRGADDLRTVGGVLSRGGHTSGFVGTGLFVRRQRRRNPGVPPVRGTVRALVGPVLDRVCRSVEHL